MISHTKILKKINRNKFFYLKRNATHQELQKIINLGETGVEIVDSYKRKYLHKSLFSHVIGEVDIDNRGISGLEMSLDKSSYDQDLISSLDLRIQHIVRDEILNAMSIFGAIGGSGLVININNGEILSMVSLPDFDPNISKGEKFNRNTLGLYEFGSVMKTFTAAIGFEENKFNINTKFEIGKNIKVGKDRVTDTHPPCQNKFCSVEDIFSESSNIGTIKMVREIGTDYQKKYFNRLGLFDRVNLNLPELSAPLYPDIWRPVNTDSISYGYGISITPLHLALATSTVLNGGYIIEPSLIKR